MKDAQGTQGRFKRVVFILFDGSRPDIFEELLEAGSLPAIREHLLEPGCYRPAVGAFPSVSGAGHLPFMTGCFPGTLNVSGIYWLDRDVYGRSRSKLRGFRTYLGPFKVEKMNRDVTADTPTLADVWPDARYVFAWYTRKSPRRALLTRWTKGLSFVRGFLTKDWLQCDVDAENKLMAGVELGSSFVFSVFPAPDEIGHRFGPKSEEVKLAYLNLDKVVARLFERLKSRGEAETTMVVVASDHGQSTTHTHFSVDRFVEERLGRTMVYKRFVTEVRDPQAVVLHSGNGMANVYLRGQGWSAGRPDLRSAPYAKLVDELIQRPEVDVLGWREPDGWIRVASARGHARLRELGPSELEYEPLDRDPFGYEGLSGRLSFDDILAQTFDHAYPDGPVGLATHMRAARSGDLIVTSHPGFDLRDWWEYQEPHGTHGALHRKQALVPVITNAALPPGPWRAVDLYPTMARLTGRALPMGVEGTFRG